MNNNLKEALSIKNKKLRRKALGILPYREWWYKNYHILATTHDDFKRHPLFDAFFGYFIDYFRSGHGYELYALREETRIMNQLETPSTQGS